MPHTEMLTVEGLSIVSNFYFLSFLFIPSLPSFLPCCVCCAVYHMMETGWVKVSQTDVRELHYQYQEEKKLPSHS